MKVVNREGRSLGWSVALIVVVLAMGALTPVHAQTGKISGTVVDAETEEPLPGVNVVVVGTQRGATTNVDGNYTILNVAPGTHDVRASFVGFATVIQEGVQVSIDLTTEVNFLLQEETQALQEVTVQAQQPVVDPDISANVANLSAADVENIPVSSLEEVIGLQAGVEPGLSIRGGGMDEVQLLVDGMSMKQGFDNTPFTGISYTSIDQMQVQTGGFNAEYGSVRSGLINVVTREGPRDRYTVDVFARYTPPQEKYDGRSPSDPEAFWIRPYLDPQVADQGVSQGWDPYTRRQYPVFEGWNAVADRVASDDDPDNDLSPDQLKELFRWQHRKDLSIDDPDYTIDASFGGPVPLVSDQLGDLRFFASYRGEQSAYLVPQNRDAYQSRMGQLKVTSNITSGIKLQLNGMYNEELGIHPYRGGGPSMFRGENPAYPWDMRSSMMASLMGNDAGSPAGYFSGRGGVQLFGNDVRSLMDITRNRVGAKWVHSLGSNTFYDVSVQRMYVDYFTRPDDRRSDEIVRTIGSLGLTEEPFGWEPTSQSTVYGMITGAEMSTAHDTSWASSWTGQFSITSQLNQYLQAKSGLSFERTTHRSNYGLKEPAYAYRNQPHYQWERDPRQGAAYVQGKAEFEGLIANAGLRFDYFDAGGTWYQYETYDDLFTSVYGKDSLETVTKRPIDPVSALSPRLGVSFPITTDSKFFFNYGHFRQMLNPSDIFVVREISSGAIDQIGNPEHPMPKTVAYELGYEHNLSNQFLLRLTGYYRDISEQARSVGFEGISGQVDYSTNLPYNYEDTRGFEVSLRKNQGWYRGFLNFTYMVRKSGNFGYASFFENPVEQRQFERESDAHYQDRPVPEPFANANIEFISPSEFGPSLGGFYPLEDWTVSWLGEWRAGQVFTWTGAQGGSFPSLSNNVRWRDYYNIDLRLTRNISTGIGDVQLFADVSNVFNIRHVYRLSAFIGDDDWEYYMQSLHLPEDIWDDIEGSAGAPYDYVYGSDEPGDFREPGTEFVPIEVVRQLPSEGMVRCCDYEGPLYYVKGEQTYYSWNGSSFQEADGDLVDRVLDNKQYIDMPNQQAFTFLNPRRVLFGIRISL